MMGPGGGLSMLLSLSSGMPVESSLAGGDGSIQLRPNEGGAPSSAGGGQWWRGGGGFFMALDSKFFDHIRFRIRPFSYLIL